MLGACRHTLSGFRRGPGQRIELAWRVAPYCLRMRLCSRSQGSCSTGGSAFGCIAWKPGSGGRSSKQVGCAH